MKSLRLLTVAILGTLSAFAYCLPASSAVIPIPFVPVWSTADDPIGCCANGPVFFTETWLVTKPGTVLVTDLAVPGDNYLIFDNALQVATTASPDCTAYVNGCVINGPLYAADPNVAWGLPQFGHASFGANAGDLITIEAYTIPTGFTDSTVAISEVPEGSTWAMLLLGFASLGIAGYRRTRKAASIAT